MSARKGFTLVELMVVVGLVGVMTAMALPSINRLVTRYVLEAAGAQMVAVLSRARMDAISRGRCVCAMMNTHFDPATSTFSARPNAITLRRLRGYDCELEGLAPGNALTSCDGADWEPFTNPAGTVEPSAFLDQPRVQIDGVNLNTGAKIPATFGVSGALGGHFDVVFRPTGRLWGDTVSNALNVRWDIHVVHQSAALSSYVVCPHGAVRRATEGC